ncbi:hypothetical protein CHGG_00108 [Chaetomium globosum CBS 148.51]|uniref:Uncharacterized protein n=1 Tax=Chaetomium globosum (strain ATCC 6205 / CBS 148.51 / DSM 1962 / NBRC 6347 / NRRL 1970) TaxID=306901 RepID=Q2HI46_CHAGB|nr:uncharacterized protein CHGG_00108 [Chaetomium globosum CBS 148.51]EAQ91873.1 hypothetical protein CHGG_00108 [Chaetomium globosum CBS 148.51]
MGIIAPSLVQIGNVAPVRPSAVFCPTTPAPLSSADLLRDFGLRAPSVMRSLGSVEAAAVTLRQKVAIEKKEDLDTSAGSEPNVGIDYRYSLSGVDLGISGGSDLGLVVEGHCMTEYGWVIDHTKDENSTDPYDDYHLDLYDEYRPWEDPNTSLPAATPAFQMKRRRPALSCREKNSWTYAGQPVGSVVALRDFPGIKIPPVLLDILETTLRGGPMLVRLGSASGSSALRSRTTSPNGVIDASSSSMFTDMERLILASYVATRNIFTDAVILASSKAPQKTMLIARAVSFESANPAAKESAIPENKTSSPPDITEPGTPTASPENDERRAHNTKWSRFHVLAAAQLFRCVYEQDPEQGTMRESRNAWRCDSSAMNHYGMDDEPFVIETCHESKCMGHLRKKIEESDKTGKRSGHEHLGQGGVAA